MLFCCTLVIRTHLYYHWNGHIKKKIYNSKLSIEKIGVTETCGVLRRQVREREEGKAVDCKALFFAQD